MILLYKIIRKIYFLKIRFKISYFFYRYIFGGVIKKINGYKMYLNLKNDTGIARELFNYGKREHFSTDFFLSSNIIKKNDIVLDVGANIGYYALLESGLIGNYGQVYALEPVSQNIKNLKKNIKLNNIKNIKTFQLAAGNENTKINIYIHEKGNQSSILKREDKEYVGEEEISMIKIDDFIVSKKITPSLVRMDVEGYEYAVLQGMQSYIQKTSVSLLIEFHPHILTVDQKKIICDILKTSYDRAVVIKDLNSQYLTLNGTVRPLLKFFDKKIGQSSIISDQIIPDGVTEIDIETLCKYLMESPCAFHVFIEGNKRFI